MYFDKYVEEMTWQCGAIICRDPIDRVRIHPEGPHEDQSG